MTGPITFEAAAFLFGMIIPVIGLALWLVIWLLRRFAQLDKRIDDGRLYAAEHFATKDGLSDALKAMQNSIEKLTSRFDAWMAREARRPGNGGD